MPPQVWVAIRDLMVMMMNHHPIMFTHPFIIIITTISHYHIIILVVGIAIMKCLMPYEPILAAASP